MNKLQINGVETPEKILKEQEDRCSAMSAANPFLALQCPLTGQVQ